MEQLVVVVWDVVVRTLLLLTDELEDDFDFVVLFLLLVLLLRFWAGFFLVFALGFVTAAADFLLLAIKDTDIVLSSSASCALDDKEWS